MKRIRPGWELLSIDHLSVDIYQIKAAQSLDLYRDFRHRLIIQKYVHKYKDKLLDTLTDIKELDNSMQILFIKYLLHIHN